eukprot:scaffold6584_cov208-Skeletonema_marinoi.AAC.4
MASRKKANGKARMAAKAKAKAAAPNHQNQPLQGGRQMQMIDTERSDSVAKCNHGLVPSHYHWKSHGEFLNTSNDMKLCKVFLQAFVDEFDGAGGDFLAAYHATKKKYADVWKDFGKMSFVVSFFLACGTSKVLEDILTPATFVWQNVDEGAFLRIWWRVQNAWASISCIVYWINFGPAALRIGQRHSIEVGKIAWKNLGLLSAYSSLIKPMKGKNCCAFIQLKGELELQFKQTADNVYRVNADKTMISRKRANGKARRAAKAKAKVAVAAQNQPLQGKQMQMIDAEAERSDSVAKCDH